jgi:hypothetical protein
MNPLSTTADRDLRMDAGEFQPFIRIAREKGLSLGPPSAGPAPATSVWQMDKDLVKLSVENAIARARCEGKMEMAQRIANLLEHGTIVEQINFVAGEYGTYYFPQDVEKMVASGPHASHPCRFEKLAWLRSLATDDGRHFCEEREARICLIFDPASPHIDRAGNEERRTE